RAGSEYAEEARFQWPDRYTLEAEQDAARKAAVHAASPLVSHADALGRTILTVAHNRYVDDEAEVDTFSPTRVVFDFEGNEREVIDALGRVVIRYEYDMLGNPVRQSSMEAGERWILTEVAGNPIYGWDSRGHRLRTTHDQLRRPDASYLQTGDGAELLVG